MKRITLILIAAAVVIAVAWLSVHYLPGGFRGFRTYRRRPLEPRLNLFPKLLLEVALTIVGAFAARKLFRLHL